MSSAADTRAASSPVAIELEGVQYSIAGRAILKGVDLAVPAGKIMSIMGASGCGKTTLLKTIIGLVRPDSGRILVEGQDLAALDERKLNEARKQMGLVFQYAALFDSLTVWENVGFGLLRQRRPRREIDETVERLLVAVGLRRDVKDLYPNELSGGMQKRVGMARALALDPKIVLYDEPTSGLDLIMATTIDELIVSLCEQFRTTAVVVSHHLPSILRISAQVAMLSEGKIIAHGTPEQIRQTDDPIVRQFLAGSTKGPLAAGDLGAEEVR